MKSVTGGAVRVTESSIARGSGSGAGNKNSLISNFPRGDILEPICTAPDPEQMIGKAGSGQEGDVFSPRIATSRGDIVQNLACSDNVPLPSAVAVKGDGKEQKKNRKKEKK